MRGAMMTSDALVASLVIILIIVAWVQAHSLVVGGTANEARLEAKKMRLLAYSDAVAREAKEGKPAPASAAFGIADVKISSWNLDENKITGTNAGAESGERICIRRLVTLGDGAGILEVCA